MSWKPLKNDYFFDYCSCSCITQDAFLFQKKKKNTSTNKYKFHQKFCFYIFHLIKILLLWLGLIHSCYLFYIHSQFQNNLNFFRLFLTNKIYLKYFKICPGPFFEAHFTVILKQNLKYILENILKYILEHIPEYILEQNLKYIQSTKD
jgi:hypothetical protein